MMYVSVMHGRTCLDYVWVNVDITVFHRLLDRLVEIHYALCLARKYDVNYNSTRLNMFLRGA